METSKRTYSCRNALSKKLVPFLSRSELTDIHIKVGQKTFAAHRLVLGSWSDELASMITISEQVIELSSNATEKEIEVFESVLNFLYTGKMSFSTDNVRMVMSLASRLGLKKLGEMAQDWLGDMINQGSMVSAVTWLRDAGEYDYLSLKNGCLRTLSLYFQYIPESSWLGLSLEELCRILDRDDLVADSELEVITRVDDWLKAKGNPQDNMDLYTEIVPKIRIPFIETFELLRLQETSPIIKFAAEHYPSVLSESFKYRALSTEVGLLVQEDDAQKSRFHASYASLIESDFQPRLYLDFAPPGKSTSSTHSQRSHRQNSTFREMNFESSYKSPMKCMIREITGVWTLESGHYNSFDILPKLETIQVGDAEAWSVRYEITSDRLPSDAAKYKMVIVTRPHDKDAEFYLPENPIVLTEDGSLNKSSGEQRKNISLSVSTPPIFAGRKPRRVEVAAIVYLVKICHETDSAELD